MRVISRRKLRDFWARHKESEAPLKAWCSVAKKTDFRDFAQVKAAFGAATDQVGPFTVFDVGGNKCRLIAIVNYRRRIVFTRHVLTHEEYDRWNKKQRDKEIKEHDRLVEECERRKKAQAGSKKDAGKKRPKRK